METRKIQKTGGATYIVSLPKKWVSENGLKSGDVVAIEADAASLRVWNPNTDQGEKRIVLGLNRDRNIFERLFISAYINGFDSVIVKGRNMIDLETKDFVKNLTKRFIGMEVVNEKTDMMQINSIVGSGALSVKSGLRRMSVVTTMMLEDSFKAFGSMNKKMCDDVVWRDNDVNRLSLFVVRRCHEILEGRITGEAEKREVPDLLLFSRTIERIADHAKSIASNTKNLDVIDSDMKASIEDAGDSVVELFKEATNAFFKDDAEGANKIIDRARDMSASIRDLSYSKSVQKTPTAYIIESIRRSFSYTSDLGEIVINHAVSSFAEKDV